MLWASLEMLLEGLRLALGALLGHLGMVLDRSWAVLGHAWVLGDLEELCGGQDLALISFPLLDPRPPTDAPRSRIQAPRPTTYAPGAAQDRQHKVQERPKTASPAVIPSSSLRNKRTFKVAMLFSFFHHVVPKSGPGPASGAQEWSKITNIGSTSGPRPPT